MDYHETATALPAKLYVNGDVQITNGKYKGEIDGISNKGSGMIITDDERTQINTNKNAITDLNTNKQAEISSENRLSATLIGLNGNVSDDEYGYLDGVTSNIQTQINGATAGREAILTALEQGLGEKEDKITSSSRLNANLIGDGSVENGAYGYLNDVTGNIQAQFNVLETDIERVRTTVPYDMVIPLSDEKTDLEATPDGEFVVTFVAPRAFSVVGMAIGLSDYGSGTVEVSVDIKGSAKKVSIKNQSGSTFTKSEIWTVLTLAQGDVIKCSITSPGIGAKGLKLYLLGVLAPL